MYIKQDNIVFSPSDLTVFWESRFASWMDRLKLEQPMLAVQPDEDDSMHKILQTRGYSHEDQTIARLENEGKKVTTIDDKSSQKALADTIAAMKSGSDVIFQARLESLPMAGYADFLMRVPGESKLGSYHYEIWDTKLAAKVKPYFILQLCAYAEMIEKIQGRLPEHVAIVLGNQERVDLKTKNYYYFYQSVKNEFLSFHQSFDPEKRPDPELSSSHGHWSKEAANIIENQDGLSQIAGIRVSHIKNLHSAGIYTMTELSKSELTHIESMSSDTFKSLKEQCSIQIRSKGRDRPEYEIKKTSPGRGLEQLPANSSLDVFFDIEGFPLFEGGLEYLWGATYLENGDRCFRDFWAHDRDQEKKAFEGFIDWVYARWQKDPAMHVYHYAPYEITTIRRLMGRFATKEYEVDQLLRNEVFVDLYKIVTGSLLVGEPRYSIKNIEHLYRGKRKTQVADGGASIAFYELWLEEQDGPTWRESKILKELRDYNIDDTESTLELTQWLRKLQADLSISPKKTRPSMEDDIQQKPDDKDPDLKKLKDALVEASSNRPEGLILADLLDFHEREQKPMWWRYFDRLGASYNELFSDLECIAGLTAIGDAVKESRSLLREYSYDPKQQCKLSKGVQGVNQDDPSYSLSIKQIDYKTGKVLIKTGANRSLPDIFNFVLKESVNIKALQTSLKSYCANWLENPNKKCAVIDFLRKCPPRLRSLRKGPLLQANKDQMTEIIECVNDLDCTILCIQGPPGAGKTYTAENIILSLIKKGKKVGITSNSHKAINNLLLRSMKKLQAENISCDAVKVESKEDESLASVGIKNVKTGSKISHTDSLQLIGGTAWTFAHENQIDAIDYLFIDEAGQVSIANLVAMASCCKNIILMGDQMQLAQPITGSHPGDSGLSALDYLLGNRSTIAADQGIFLPTTYRMHPAVCQLISDMVYDGKLKSAKQTENQKIITHGHSLIPIQSGIAFLACHHEGNRQHSEEEISLITQLFKELLSCNYENCIFQ